MSDSSFIHLPISIGIFINHKSSAPLSKKGVTALLFSTVPFYLNNRIFLLLKNFISKKCRPNKKTSTLLAR